MSSRRNRLLNSPQKEKNKKIMFILHVVMSRELVKKITLRLMLRLKTCWRRGIPLVGIVLKSIRYGWAAEISLQFCCTLVVGVVS